MKTKILFLNPPSLSKFDSGGSRFQAKRKANTLWYPTWLAYSAGVVEDKGFGIKLIDASAESVNVRKLLKITEDFGPSLIIVNTSTPSFSNDCAVCDELFGYLQVKPKIILTGAHVSVLPAESLKYSPSIWGVARKEYEYTVLELATALEEGDDHYDQILGLSWKLGDQVIHNPDRPFIECLDEMPFATRVYRKHLDIRKYRLAFALYPYVSIYSGRGCPYRCIYCLWPQTISGHKYRVRSPESVVEELKYVRTELPEVKEVFFDDDTFTADRERLHKICDRLICEQSKVTWSCNARADLDLQTLAKMKNAGCRLLVVGYESSSQAILSNIKKGISVYQMEEFTQKAKRAGLMIHGTFIMGLPGETKETMRDTGKLARRLNLDTVQFSVATPFPGTEFYQWCCESGIMTTKDFSAWVDGAGYQNCIIEYPHLSSEEVVRAVDHATMSFYWRFSYFLTILKQVARDPSEASRIRASAPAFLKYSIERLTRRH